MNGSFLEQWVGMIRSALAGMGLQDARGRLTARFQVTMEPDGALSVRPAAPDEATAQILEVEFGATAAPKGSTLPGPVTRSTQLAAEPAEGGDSATLVRRLELVLGGPPGFTTGARAEVLVDLLQEFGRAELVTRLKRDWIREFDTGPDASAAVVKAPGSGSRPRLPDGDVGA